MGRSVEKGPYFLGSVNFKFISIFSGFVENVVILTQQN